MPSQPFFVELDHSLGALEVGLFGRDQVGLVTCLPLDQKHQFACKKKEMGSFVEDKKVHPETIVKTHMV